MANAIANKSLLRFYFDTVHLYNSWTRGTKYANKVQKSSYNSLLRLSQGRPAIYPLQEIAKARRQQYEGKDMPRPNYASANFKADTSVPKVKMAGAFYAHAGGSMYNNYATKREILKKAYRQAALDAARKAKTQGLDAAATKALHHETINRVKEGVRAVATTQQLFYMERNIRGKIAGITDYLGFAEYNKGVVRSTRAGYREALTKLQNDVNLKYVPKSHTNIIREGYGVAVYRKVANIGRHINVAASLTGKHFQTHGTKYAIGAAVVGAGILAYRNRGTIAAYAGDKRVQASLSNLKNKALVGSGFAVAGHYLAQSKNTVAQFSGRILQGLGSGLIIGALAHTTNTVLNKPRMDARDAQKATLLAQRNAQKTAKMNAKAAKQAPTKQALLSKAEVGRRISEGLKKSNKIKHIR